MSESKDPNAPYAPTSRQWDYVRSRVEQDLDFGNDLMRRVIELERCKSFLMFAIGFASFFAVINFALLGVLSMPWVQQQIQEVRK